MCDTVCKLVCVIYMIRYGHSSPLQSSRVSALNRETRLLWSDSSLYTGMPSRVRVRVILKFQVAPLRQTSTVNFNFFIVHSTGEEAEEERVVVGEEKSSCV